MNKIKHIAVVGNIGAGKTTLTNLLAQHYGWQPQFEKVDDNPYISDFYNDMQRWSFNLQIYFLNSRLKQLLEIQKTENTVIQDRTIYEDAYIFAPNLFEMGLMTRRDFENYLSIFNTIKKMIRPPELLIYLQASLPALVDQIQRRGREYEDSIRLDYLKRLNEHYNNFIDEYKEGKVLVINVDECNFAESSEDLAKVISKIDTEINALFK